jgi:hypothetical protein
MAIIINLSDRSAKGNYVRTGEKNAKVGLNYVSPKAEWWIDKDSHIHGSRILPYLRFPITEMIVRTSYAF